LGTIYKYSLPSHSVSEPKTHELRRELGLLDATSIVIGTTIGVGIFLVPGLIARELGSSKLILATWVITGIISFFGAMAYAELGAMMPESGGQYVYLREAYGAPVAFVCGWVAFLVTQSGSIAAVSVGFGIYLSYLLPRVPGVIQWAPLAVIALFTCLNYRGAKTGAHTQNLLTLLKVAGLLLLIGSAFLSGRPAPAAVDGAKLTSFPLYGLAAATLGCFVAYDGWQYIAFVAGEVRRPQRNLPLSLGLGTGAVILLYVLANVAYFRVLPFGAIAASDHVAADLAQSTMGAVGGTLISVIVMISSAGAANGAILTSSRLYFAQARNGLFFRRLAEVHPRFGTPSVSILAQGVWSALLTLSGSYDVLISYALFAMWLFHGMAVLGVVVLRRKHPERTRPYRMWGYPVTPILFVAFALWFVVNMFVTRTRSSLAGMGIVAAGGTAYFIWKKWAASADA
jgi:APA family basic amino acid/polyamine antiporter